MKLDHDIAWSSPGGRRGVVRQLVWDGRWHALVDARPGEDLRDLGLTARALLEVAARVAEGVARAGGGVPTAVRLCPDGAIRVEIGEGDGPAALGRLLYEVCTGARLARATREIGVTALGPPMREIVARCLSNPEWEEVARECALAASERVDEDGLAEWVAPSEGFERRTGAAWLFAGGVLGLLVVGVTLAVVGLRGPPPTPETTAPPVVAVVEAPPVSEPVEEPVVAPEVREATAVRWARPAPVPLPQPVEPEPIPMPAPVTVKILADPARGVAVIRFGGDSRAVPVGDVVELPPGSHTVHFYGENGMWTRSCDVQVKAGVDRIKFLRDRPGCIALPSSSGHQ